MRDLVAHTAEVHGRTATICEVLPIDRIPGPQLPDEADPFEWAAEQLASMADQAGVGDALVETAAWDPFWGVRKEAIHGLGTLGPDQHLAVLLRAAGDTSSEVRAAAVEAIGNTDDPELVPYLVERYQQDASFLVKAAAVRSVGRCGGAASMPFLSEATATDSPNDVVRRAAREAVENLPTANAEH